MRPGRESAPPEEEVIEIDPAELSGIFSAPVWLRDLGFSPGDSDEVTQSYRRAVGVLAGVD